jgi:hypothetical protein
MKNKMKALVIARLYELGCRPRRVSGSKSGWVSVCPSCLRLGPEDGSLGIVGTDDDDDVLLWCMRFDMEPNDTRYDEWCPEWLVWAALGIDRSRHRNSLKHEANGVGVRYLDRLTRLRPLRL